MPSLITCPNELLQEIALHLPLNDILALRTACSRIEQGLRSHVRLKHFNRFQVPFSEAGLIHLARKTQCQCFLRGLKMISIKFYQAPLFFLDDLKPPVLDRLRQIFIASPWRDSGPLPARITRRLDQWESYGNFYKAQRRLFEGNIDVRLLEDIMSNISEADVIVNVEYEEATNFAPVTCGEDLRDLFAAVNAMDVMRISQSARLSDMAQRAGRAVGYVQIT